MNKHLVYTVLLFCVLVPPLSAIKSVYIPRSQGHAPSMTCMPAFNYTVIATLNYAQSYDGDLIACDLFGSNVLHFSGSQVLDRSPRDLLADNFGCAPDFQSTLTFSPKIQNVLFALYFNQPLDKILPGLYVNVMFPVNYARWSLNPCETVINRGAPIYQNGYVGDTLASFTQVAPLTPSIDSCTCNTVTPAPSPAAPAATAASVQSYFQGQVITGDILRPLAYNKISWCPLNRTELAELIVRLGRNLIANDVTFLSVFVRASFQTGNKQRPEFLFAPVCGNGKFFELGLGVQGQHTFTFAHNPTCVTLLWDASFEHLFKTKMLRTFDLCDQGPLSRYLLLKRIDPTTFAYDEELIEASYVTTYPANVSRGAQGDLDLKVSINYQGFTQNVGFALWGTSQENISLFCNQPTCPTGGNLYGIKGTTGAYNYITSGTLAITLEPLNATAFDSTITTAGPIDNPVSLPNTTPYNNVSGTTVINPAILAIASQGPLVIGPALLNLDSARSPAQLTYCFYLESGYTWQMQHTTPSVLIGASVETATHAPAELHQWSIWLKGSLIW